MCELCNGTNVVHELLTIGYRTGCCPVCGPEPDEKWYSRLNTFKDKVTEMKGKMEGTYGHSNH